MLLKQSRQRLRLGSLGVKISRGRKRGRESEYRKYLELFHYTLCCYFSLFVGLSTYYARGFEYVNHKDFASANALCGTAHWLSKNAILASSPFHSSKRSRKI
mmetsp:Transcript_8473/g.19187  ORF Transcript_8473/g.19187 Transcript_8473/m.19187 type:complete len:102 (+) Transcript_8473:1737-2042(+)